ncbi:hypothetical protein M1534_01035 [Patescibacteria group bacterium]|jgi:uncharacterized protein (TIGR00725 family)|nr:hypothetical protein [Patescibacteria group bacterium]
MPEEQNNAFIPYSDRIHLKYKVVVSGAAETGHCAPNALELAKEIGRQVVLHNGILVTGATSGIPYWSAIGAKEAGGFVVGLSPAASEREHINTYHLPVDYHDVIIYTGFNYAGRNLFLIRSGDAVISICGRMGTLNEFTIGFEDDKPLGVLLGSGGMADMLPDIVNNAHRGQGKTVFNSDPKELLEEVLKLVDEEKLVKIKRNV